MTKRQKNKIKKQVYSFLNNYRFLVVGIAISLVVGCVYAYAANEYATASITTENINVAGDLIVERDNGAGIVVADETLGSAEMPDCANAGNISGCPTTLGNLYLEGAFEVDGVAYLEGGITMDSGDAVSHGGLQTYVYSGTLADATTTLFCVANPFSTTSSIDFAEVEITGASTTTISLYVATSTVNVGLTTSTASIATATALIQASSVGANRTGIIQNNANTTRTGIFAGGSVAKIFVTPSEYVCGVVGDDSGSTAGVTNASNTFAGNYYLRFIQ